MDTDSDDALSQWRSALLGAWIETRMELDRSLLALSVAGIGLLVTLLTTVEIRWWWMLAPYAIAITAFVIAIHAAINIFEANAVYLQRAANDPAVGLDPKLESLDRRLRRCFWMGVATTIIVGLAGGVGGYFEPKEETVPENKGGGKPGSGIEQHSLNGITGFRPVVTSSPSPAGGQGGQSGGGGNSGGQTKA